MYARIYDQGMTPYHLWVRRDLHVALTGNFRHVLFPLAWHRSRGSRFSSRGYSSCGRMEGFIIQGWDLVIPGVRRDLSVAKRGNYRRALASANHKSASGVWIHTPCAAASTRGVSVLVPGLLGVVDI